MADKMKDTRMVSATFIGAPMKKDEYFAKTPRLMHAIEMSDAGNWIFFNFSREGEQR
jgi:hypothetical protein